MVIWFKVVNVYVRIDVVNSDDQDLNADSAATKTSTHGGVARAVTVITHHGRRLQPAYSPTRLPTNTHPKFRVRMHLYIYFKQNTFNKTATYTNVSIHTHTTQLLVYMHVRLTLFVSKYNLPRISYSPCSSSSYLSTPTNPCV
jgi:hypothetical protein